MIGKTNSQTGGTLKGEKLNISLFTNQSSHADVLGAIVTVTNQVGATQYVWEGYEITVAVFPGVEYEVSVSDVDGYKTPDKFTATSVADNARTISFEYKAEKVKVNISASNGMDMTGANVSINGKDYTYQGSAIEALVPFGTEYSVQAASVGSLVTPPVQFFTASIPLREINLEYRTSTLMVKMLSNQGNDTTIANLKASVTYGSTMIEVANGEVVDIPAGASITITFPEVENYNTPAPITFTTNTGMNERSVTYSTELVIVNASANDGNSVDGVTATVNRYKKQPYTPANGIYIQDVEGFLYTASEWDDTKTPNGVAVVSDTCQFVIALSDVGSKSWGPSQNISNIVSTDNEWTAKADYSGDANTTQIVSQIGTDADYAAQACRKFIFPNGKAGYLPAAGELFYACTWRVDINAALSKCGGTAFIDEYYWSSTQYSAWNAWLVMGNSGYTRGDFGKNYYKQVRPFAALEAKIIQQYEPEEKIITNGKTQFKVEHGVDYNIVMSDKQGYETPTTKNFTAQLIVNNVSMEYIKSVSKQTVIRIDQTITDPEAMITRIVDEGGIEAIRANSHRYTGTFANGVMTLKQLDDADGTKYADGTTATLTTIGTDVWMKLPQFHWKCSQYATDVWDFEVVYGAKPDDTYKTWDGNDLIGAYEAYNSSNKSYSVSGKDSTGNVQQDKFKTYAQARGEGFSLVKWKHHCMMAMLYYTMYGNTNCQAKIGKGTSSSTKATGATNSLGMTDTVVGGNGDSNSINFWGLENWWGNKYEWMDNIVVDARVWKVTEDDGTVRQAGTGGSSNGYTSKMLFGENIDLIPTAARGSETTGFCDYYYQSSSNSRVVPRSYSNADTFGGVAYVGASNDSSVTFSSMGSRLAFRGNIVIE